MNARQALKRALYEHRGLRCEILPYLPHKCAVASDMHEVLLTKNDVRGLPPEKRSYIDSPFNVLLVCHAFHVSDGRTLAYKSAAIQALVDRFGVEALRHYLEDAPLKLPPGIMHLLPEKE